MSRKTYAALLAENERQKKEIEDLHRKTAEIPLLKKQIDERPDVSRWRQWVNESDAKTARTMARVDILLGQLAGDYFADGSKSDVFIDHPRLGTVRGAASARAVRTQVRAYLDALDRWDKIARESAIRDAEKRGIKGLVVKDEHLNAFPREVVSVTEEEPKADLLLKHLINQTEKLLSWYDAKTFTAEGGPAADLRLLRELVTQAKARFL